MLHTLCYSPWKCDLYAILRMIKSGDDLILIQNGVLGAIEGSRFFQILINYSPIVISALKADIDARGITKQISAKVNIVSYTDFVNLAVKHTNQIRW